MKTIETKGGMIFEVIESLKEIKSYIMDGYIDNKEFLDDDFALYIRYKDGSEYYLCGAVEDGRFKKTGIETVIESNPSSYIIYGKSTFDDWLCRGRFSGCDMYQLHRD